MSQIVPCTASQISNPSGWGEAEESNIFFRSVFIKESEDFHPWLKTRAISSWADYPGRNQLCLADNEIQAVWCSFMWMDGRFSGDDERVQDFQRAGRRLNTRLRGVFYFTGWKIKIWLFLFIIFGLFNWSSCQTLTADSLPVKMWNCWRASSVCRASSKTFFLANWPHVAGSIWPQFFFSLCLAVLSHRNGHGRKKIQK